MKEQPPKPPTMVRDQPLTEPPLLGPQQAGYCRAFQNALMIKMQKEGFSVAKDVMWTGRINDSASYKEMLDWLEFYFVKDQGGTVERGTSVAEGKVHHMAIFTPKKTIN